MALIYFFIALGIFAICAGIWGYFDHRKRIKSIKQERYGTNSGN